MVKKSFKGGVGSLLGEATRKGASTPKRGRPKTQFKTITKTSQIGTKENETRATFIINEDQLEKVKAVAYWDRMSIKEVLGLAIDAYLGKKEELSKAIEAYKRKSKAS